MRPMSPLAPFRKRTLSAGIAIALAVTLPLLGLRGVAHADLGDAPSSKSSSDGMNQVDDSDKPKDLDKKPTEPGVDLTAKPAPPPSAPFYERWQFWALAGAVIVGVVVVVLGGRALAHQLNGGDVRPCNMDFKMRCFGEGH
jgi:hypothetical protein